MSTLDRRGATEHGALRTTNSISWSAASEGYPGLPFGTSINVSPWGQTTPFNLHWVLVGATGAIRHVAAAPRLSTYCSGRADEYPVQVEGRGLAPRRHVDAGAEGKAGIALRRRRPRNQSFRGPVMPRAPWLRGGPKCS